jgi:hypothetical protein
MRKKRTFSIIKGYSFEFQEEGHQIEAWFSALSGLEKVYIDGELVSSQRNLSKNSTNTFKIGVNEYSTNMKVISLLKGPFVCTLSKNGFIYRRQKLIFPNVKRNLLLMLLFCIGLSVAFEMAKKYLQLQNESVYIFIILIISLIFIFNLKTSKDSKPVIEEEAIV